MVIIPADSAVTARQDVKEENNMFESSSQAAVIDRLINRPFELRETRVALRAHAPRRVTRNNVILRGLIFEARFLETDTFVYQ